jgi:glycosyltransferase involved in cell wall biosynthesis
MQENRRDLAGGPSLSIIVPAHNAAHDIAGCLSAIRASAMTFAHEIIVVDDASSDETGSIAAAFADEVIALPGTPRGPAFARNHGVAASRSPIAVFIDADVMVHADAIARMMAALDTHDIAAVFGSYDDNPVASGIVSQYRNLLHHLVHQRSAGDVQSFWAGCGAVTKSAFNAVGGFDANRFHHPEMEDVELGYRLIDHGYRIMLDPEIRCSHRKKITLPGMIKSDFMRRGVPWAKVLLDRREFLAPRGLSLSVWERVSALTSVSFALSVIAAVIRDSPTLAILAVAALALFIIGNAGLLRRLARIRGVAFALAAVPLHLVYNVTAVAALVWTLVSYPLSPSERVRYTRPQ